MNTIAPTEFIDCNCMLGQWKKNVESCFYTADDLISFINKASISKCLVFGSLAKYSEIQTGNNILINAIKDNERLIPCAIAMPHHSGEFPHPKEFYRYLANNNIRAVRIFPTFHGVSLYTWLWNDLFTILESAKIPLFIDFSLKHWSEEINWEQIKNICENFPLLPIILIRMSLKADRYIYYLMQNMKNLYIETSYYLVNNGIEKLVKSFGAEKLIFGTGIPVYNPNPSITMLNFSDINENERQMIAGGNLMKLLEEVKFDAKQDTN